MLAAALDETVFDCALVGRRLSRHDSFCFRSPLFLVLVYSLPKLTTPHTLTTSSTSSVFMTVGAADTPWHPQFFQCRHFRILRLTEDSATGRASVAFRSNSVL